MNRTKELREMRKHSQALEEIVSKPFLIGIDVPLLVTSEVLLYDSGRRVLGEIDIFSYDAAQGYLIAEYKSHHSRGNEVKAREQLARCSNHLERHFGIKAKKLYVTPNYVQEVK